MRALAVTTGLVLTDQLSKWLVRVNFPFPGDGCTLIAGFFDLRYVRNTGAAWGMLAGRQLFLIVFSLLALSAMLGWYRHALARLPLGWLTLGLLTGGIIGNLIDRVWLGYVVDFLDFYLGSSHFPAFNVADAAICTGVGLYLLTQWMVDRRTGPNTANPKTS